MNPLQERIIYLSQKLKLSHIGSNLSCLPILEEIYSTKKPQDIVILDNAHAHLAHLLVKFPDASNESIEELIKTYGIHCDKQAGCDASGGSLGHGIGIGTGYALSDRTYNVYITVSDGSMMEGSNAEALRLIHDLEIKNIYIYCNFNGYTAVAKREWDKLVDLILMYLPPENIKIFETNNVLPELKGLEGHYKVL